MVKRLAASFMVALTFAIPQLTFAASQATVNAGTVIDNFNRVSSLDMSVAVDIETKSDDMTAPAKMQVGADIASNLTDNVHVQYHSWSVDDKGKRDESNGGLMYADKQLFITDDSGVWYAFDKEDSALTFTQTDPSPEDVAEVKQLFQELLDRGVISYRLEAVDMINGKPAVRYGFTVNNDRAIDMLVQKGAFSAEDANEIRTEIANKLSVGGTIWIDTVTMLPAMVIVNVNMQSSASTYTMVNVTMHFHSFNESIAMSAPKNAKSIDAYSEAQRKKMSDRLEKTVSLLDTDGDGISDDNETYWRTNPLRKDSDNDGHSDRTELINGYNPNGKGELDSDGDGLSDYAEVTIYHTNRYSRDTDRDGYADGVEIAHGYNPNGKGKLK